jgi:hypothetical protein
VGQEEEVRRRKIQCIQVRYAEVTEFEKKVGETRLKETALCHPFLVLAPDFTSDV